MSDAIGASTIVPVTLTDGVTPAEVTARESFEGSVAGIGHIAYRGNPGSVEQSVSGLGRIEAD